MVASSSQSPLVRFTLRPLDDIEPWGQPGDLSLSWFAMTDGYYELNVGDAEIFRYDSGACSLLGWPPPSAPSGFAHSVDYQVARLFHDFAEILPAFKRFTDGAVLLAHNAHFDVRFVRAEAARTETPPDPDPPATGGCP